MESCKSKERDYSNTKLGTSKRIGRPQSGSTNMLISLIYILFNVQNAQASSMLQQSAKSDVLEKEWQSTMLVASTVVSCGYDKESPLGQA